MRTLLIILAIVLLTWTGVQVLVARRIYSESMIANEWKTLPVDVDGDGIDETLFLRTDEDTYHLGAQHSFHGHIGILGSGPGWGLRYTALAPGGTLLDTGVRDSFHVYNTRKDALEGDNVVTEWEADDVLLRRTIDMTGERAIIHFELVNLLPKHIRDVCFKSEFRFDDYVYGIPFEDQTVMAWDGYRSDWPDSPAIFHILHLSKPDTLHVEPIVYYGLTSATWGPHDLCAQGSLEYALVVLWNTGFTSVDSTLSYLDEKVSEYMALQDTIVSSPVECDSVGVAERRESHYARSGGAGKLLSCSAVPTPFAGRVVIHYEIPERGYVRLEVYDSVGELVSSLAEGLQDEGPHQAVWDQANTAFEGGSGTYFARLTAGGAVATAKLVLVH